MVNLMLTFKGGRETIVVHFRRVKRMPSTRRLRGSRHEAVNRLRKVVHIEK